MYVGFQPNDGVRKFPSSPELAADSQPDAPRNFASGITPGSVGEDVETPDLIHSERRITLEVKQASTSEAGGTMVQIPFEGSSPGQCISCHEILVLNVLDLSCLLAMILFHVRNQCTRTLTSQADPSDETHA